MSAGDRPGRALRAGVATTAALLAHTVVNARLLRTPPARRPADRPVSVLIPARDEADRIAPCVRAVLATDWDDLQVLVLDDRSTDRTGDLVRRAAAGDPRLRVLDGRRLPDGWLGKPWSCSQLAAAADGDVLVFVDADVVLEPHAVAATVGLIDHGLDVACPYPRQVAERPLARLVQPLLQWSWLTFLPLRLAEASPRPSLTAANGQILACTAVTYAKIGGHEAVRDEVIEDIALARNAKAAGLRAGVADGTALATCHMYSDDRALIAGYTKSLWSAFGSPAGAAAVTGVLGWLYIHPVVAVVRALAGDDRPTARLAALGYALGVAGRTVAARRTAGRPGDAPTHPLSIAALAWLTWRSTIGRRRGTLEWSGRPVRAGTGRSGRHETERRR